MGSRGSWHNAPLRNIKGEIASDTEENI